MIYEPQLPYGQDGRHYCTLRGLSWSSIFIGALVGFGLGFLLNIFSFAIGLTAFVPTTSGLMKLAVGGFIGLLIGGIATMFVSGWAAGYFARSHCCNPRYGIIYGFTAWCLAVIISIFVAGYVGQFMTSQPYLAGQNSAIITNVHAQTMQAVSQKSNINPPASANRAEQNTEMAAHNLGLSLFITFVLFFVGALSSCFGGYFGMHSRIRKEPFAHVGHDHHDRVNEELTETKIDKIN